MKNDLEKAVEGMNAKEFSQEEMNELHEYFSDLGNSTLKEYNQIISNSYKNSNNRLNDF